MAGRLGKGLTGGAREEREEMTGCPNMAMRGKGLTCGVVAGLLCGYRGRMGARVNFKRFLELRDCGCLVLELEG